MRRGQTGEREPWEGRPRMKRVLQVVRFEGIHTDSLGHYFISLGLLRAASRQWPNIGGCWRHGRFVLLGEELSFDAVFRHVLES